MGQGRPPRALQALAVATAVLLGLRLAAATRVGFGDSEALYACYALHPQPAYLDHPWLIGFLAHLLGGGSAPSPLAAHVFTAIVATLAPWALLLGARVLGASWGGAAGAALGVAVVPEIALGLFAMTPDLPLFFAWGAALVSAGVGLRAAASSNRAAAALVAAGLCAGVAAAAKVSGIALALGLLATYLTPPARKHARTPWPWLGLAAGGILGLPVLAFESRAGWPMLRHRLIDTQGAAGVSLRNAGALILGQAAYLSPLIAALAVIVARDLWRRRGDADPVTRLLFHATLVPLAVLVPLCLWSRVAEPHWIAPALLALPLHYARRAGEGVALGPRWLRTAGAASAAFIALAIHLWVLVPASVSLLPASSNPRLDLANELYGWPEAVAAVRQTAAAEWVPLETLDDVVVVGPHWTVCAQLHAALRADLHVGCADPQRDDFDDWSPRRKWMAAETLVFVTDDRYPVDLDAMFPDRTRTREASLTILRGGREARTFSITVLGRRAPA